MTTPDGPSSAPAADSASEQEPVVEEPFDPYRFGKPDYPIPPEYAPPGYVPPVEISAPPVEQSPYAQQPYAQQPYGQQPYAQQPYAQQPYAQQPPGQPYGAPYQYPAPYGAPPPPQWTQYPPPRSGNGKAIAALVFGIISVLFCVGLVLDLVPVLLAIIFGAIAMSDAKRTGQPRGMAMTGLILGIVGAVLAVTLTAVVYSKVKPCFDNYSSGSSEFNSCIDDRLHF